MVGDYMGFVAGLVAEVEKEGFDMGDFSSLDHICYRVPTVDRYESKNKELERVAELLGEVVIGGRNISTFQLNDPIIAAGWRVDSIELPSPKPGRNNMEGLEHGEFVLYDPMIKFLTKYKNMAFDTRKVDRLNNPEVGYSLPSGRSVKFHVLSLTAVLQLEDIAGGVDRGTASR